MHIRMYSIYHTYSSQKFSFCSPCLTFSTYLEKDRGGGGGASKINYLSIYLPILHCSALL